MIPLRRSFIASHLALASLGTTLLSTARAADEPATQPAVAPPIAVINGTPIDNQKFGNLLMQVSGMHVFDLGLNLMLVQQACDQAGVKIDQAAAVKHFLSTVGADNFSPQEQQNVINQILARRNITPAEFYVDMQTEGGLLALAEGHVDVTDDEIKTRFTAVYGEKVDIHIIQAQSISQAAKVRELIEQKGMDPVAAAQSLQCPVEPRTVASNDDQLPKEFRETAFSLKDHQLSASIMRGGANFLIYLDKRTPAQSDVKFDTVKDEMKKQVFNIKQQNWMANRLIHLRASARVDVNDATIKPQWEAYRARLKAQIDAQQNAASQPAAATTAP